MGMRNVKKRITSNRRIKWLENDSNERTAGINRAADVPNGAQTKEKKSKSCLYGKEKKKNLEIPEIHTRLAIKLNGNRINDIYVSFGMCVCLFVVCCMCVCVDPRDS